MENRPFFQTSQAAVLGFFIALSSVVSALILSRALIDIKKTSQEVLTVTGSAERNVVSDYGVWRSEFWRRDTALTGAYASIRADLEKVKQYLLAKGVRPEELIVVQATTATLYVKNEKGADTNAIEGYQVTQGLEVRSSDVNRIADLSRISTELIDQGVQFSSMAPDYFYTHLAELKVEMLGMAAKNARERAVQMGESAGNRIGGMRSARMGVFQITPVNSFEVSDWGTNDTSSLEKKVTAVVNVTFGLAS